MTWVLAVNASRQPLTAKVSLDKSVGAVEKTAFGPTPKALDNGKVLVFDFSALGRSLVSLGEGVQEPRNP